MRVGFPRGPDHTRPQPNTPPKPTPGSAGRWPAHAVLNPKHTNGSSSLNRVAPNDSHVLL